MTRDLRSLGPRSSASLRSVCGDHGNPVALAGPWVPYRFRRLQKSKISKRLRKTQSVLRSPSEARRASEDGFAADDGPVQSHPFPGSAGASLNTILEPRDRHGESRRQNAKRSGCPSELRSDDRVEKLRDDDSVANGSPGDRATGRTRAKVEPCSADLGRGGPETDRQLAGIPCVGKPRCERRGGCHSSRRPRSSSRETILSTASSASSGFFPPVMTSLPEPKSSATTSGSSSR